MTLQSLKTMQSPCQSFIWLFLNLFFHAGSDTIVASVKNPDGFFVAHLARPAVFPPTEHNTASTGRAS